MSYVELPILNDHELQKIFAKAERTADGCLVIRADSVRGNPIVVTIRGRRYISTRLVWAEIFGDSELDTHEVIHISACPHTGGDKRHGWKDVCIEPTHLMLAKPKERVALAIERRSQYV